MATAQATVSQAPLRTHLSLKGSVALVSDFFLFGIQSILYQREIYPSDEFRNVKKFGTQVLTTTDEGLKEYLDAAMGQVKTWLERGQVKRLVVAIVEKETGETRERWQFDIDVVGKAEGEEGEEEAGSVGQDGKATSKENVDPSADKDGAKSKKKTDAQVKAEISAIIKQITASCTFLPLLEEPCAFTILAYTSLEADMPMEWSESDARLIAAGQAEQVKLRSFSTQVHRVDALVAYKREDEDE